MISPGCIQLSGARAAEHAAQDEAAQKHPHRRHAQLSRRQVDASTTYIYTAFLRVLRSLGRRVLLSPVRSRVLRPVASRLLLGVLLSLPLLSRLLFVTSSLSFLSQTVPLRLALRRRLVPSPLPLVLLPLPFILFFLHFFLSFLRLHRSPVLLIELFLFRSKLPIFTPVTVTIPEARLLLLVRMLVLVRVRVRLVRKNFMPMLKRPRKFEHAHVDVEAPQEQDHTRKYRRHANHLGKLFFFHYVVQIHKKTQKGRTRVQGGEWVVDQFFQTGKKSHMT